MINLVSTLNTIKKTIDATMNLEVKRFSPEYGWVNTKVYPLTGEEKHDENHVVTLIQGRALEAITEHIYFYKHHTEYENPSIEVLLEQGKTLKKKIDKLVSDYKYVPQFIDSEGKAIVPPEDMISMNDLFCAKGLYAWNHNYGTAEEAANSRKWLFEKVNETLSCNSKIFEDRMVGVGAMALVLKYDQSRDAFELGKKLVDYVIDTHYNDGRWSFLPYGVISYYIDDEGKPLVKNGKIEISPGDNIQFCGLTSQFINFAKELPFINDEDRKWISRTSDILVDIVEACFKVSQVKDYGFHLWTDGLTGFPVDSRMGWWQVAEGARGCLLTSSIANRNSELLKQRGFELIEIFQKQYVAKSPIGIAVQQLEPDGSAEKTVPGNPDIDAGYHTGLTHIAIFNYLEKIHISTVLLEVD